MKAKDVSAGGVSDGIRIRFPADGADQVLVDGLFIDVNKALTVFSGICRRYRVGHDRGTNLLKC